MASDESTLTVGPLDTLTGGSGLPLVPALTIVWHPHLDRIGQIAPLTNLLEVDVAHVCRSEPLFFAPGATAGEPTSHRGISKDSVLDITFQKGAFELRRVQQDEVEVDGQPLTGTRRVSSDDLARGLIITVARRFVFCLHSVHFPINRSPTLGLLGTSDGIEDVRRSIARVADKPLPVLLRGESGSGKELAARALHEAGARAKGRFVAINMASLIRERASAELFGYKKGAFTGATSDVPGHFRAAHGGTIFLDEIGYTTRDVQPMLLRVLDDNEILPLGASHFTKVDVRVVAATDAKLEQAVAEDRFERPLYNRLHTAFNINLPPLRQRREDVGVLLLHFLKKEFGDTADLQRFQDPDPRTRPWLAARDVASVALSPLPANVRSIVKLARELVAKAGDSPAADTHAIVIEFLLGKLTSPPDNGQRVPLADESTPTPVEHTEEHLVSALERANWKRKEAATFMGVSRATFYRLLERFPDLQHLLAVDLAELQRQYAACQGDVSRLAAQLGTSPALVNRRLAQKP